MCIYLQYGFVVKILQIIIRENMEPIRTIEDFKTFIANNKDLIRKNATDADDIPLDDEWMQEDEWEEDYKRGVVNNGAV